MEKRFVYKGSSIYYNIHGSGKHFIVLVHGFGEDCRIFDNLVSFPEDDFKFIVPDLPGSGQSTLLISEHEIAMDDYADCIKGLLEYEEITSCILLGHSMGGYITLSFAEKYPGMLSAFGLIHSSAAADTEEKKQSRQQGVEMIKKYGAFTFLKNTTPNLFANKFRKTNGATIEQFIQQNNSFTGEALIQYYTAMMNRADKTTVLQNAEVPVLFILGKEDVAAPVDIVIKQVPLPPNAHIHIMDNVAHMSMLEAPGKLSRFIYAFAKYTIDYKD